MTNDKMALIELIEKGADSDLVRELLAFAADRMMELEVEARTGAPAGARSADRLTHRNGYRERAWETRAGRIDLAIAEAGTTMRSVVRSSRLGSIGRDGPMARHKLGLRNKGEREIE